MSSRETLEENSRLIKNMDYGRIGGAAIMGMGISTNNPLVFSLGLGAYSISHIIQTKKGVMNFDYSQASFLRDATETSIPSL